MMDLLIEEFIEDMKKHEELRKKYEKEYNHVIYVTDLVQCTRKARLLKQLPQVNVLVSLAPKVLMGKWLHDKIENYFQKLGFNIEVPVEADYHTIIDDEVVKVKLLGRIDALKVDLCDAGAFVDIYEIKTSQKLPEQPYEHHILQVKMYTTMLFSDPNLQDKIGIARPEHVNEYIMYVTPQGIRTFPVTLYNIDVSFEELIKDYIENRKIPRYEWECNYCPFREICIR